MNMREKIKNSETNCERYVHACEKHSQDSFIMNISRDLLRTSYNVGSMLNSVIIRINVRSQGRYLQPCRESTEGTGSTNFDV